MSPITMSVRGYNRKPGAPAPAGMVDPDPLTSYNDCKGRQEKGGKEGDTDGRERGGWGEKNEASGRRRGEAEWGGTLAQG